VQFNNSYNGPHSQCPNKNVTVQLPFKLFKVNVSLYQMSWQTVPQPRTCSGKAFISIAAAGPSDETCPWVGRMQLTTAFVCLSITDVHWLTG